MSILNDTKQVLKELSPILAGFKLAIIVISYFGVGSLAKWCIEHWYPFTRKMWDALAFSLSFPEFSIPVKDSLTALIFFLPLGITAVHQIFYPSNESTSNSYRAFAGLLGVVFFFIVTKDVIGEIVSGINGSPK